MRPIVLLDGATGTELGRRGVDISLPLWSARAIEAAPETLQQIHRDYLLAGADAITANTFRTQRRTLEKASRPARDASALTRAAVELARKARDSINPSALVLGSVAPLEDCYRPDLAPRDHDTLAAEHAEHIRNLLDAGADLLLIETMNNLAEALAAIAEAQRAAPGRWLVSFCTRGQGSPPGILLSGEPISAIARDLRDANAIGVNCVAASSVEAQLRHLKSILPQRPARPRLMAYANVGEADAAGNWICTDAVDPRAYARYASQWRAAGASIIGGCCGTTPETIRALKTTLDRRAAVAAAPAPPIPPA